MIIEHPLTGERILVAPHRRERPHAMLRDHSARQPAESCPFCPGHEDETPAQVSRRGDGAIWQARAFPNLYPLTGRHEVIVESPTHSATPGALTPEETAVVLDLWRERWTAASRDPVTRAISLFRNEGRWAGRSIDHLHSQLIALDFLPERHAEQLRRFSTHRARRQHCILCTMPYEMPASVAYSSASFVVVTPPFARLPYEVWIVPAAHASRFDDAVRAETQKELAHIVQRLAAVVERDHGAFNMLVHADPGENPDFHMYIEITPRLAMFGGFELQTGLFVNPVAAGESAAFYRHAFSGDIR